MNITEWAKSRKKNSFKFEDRIKGRTEELIDKELTLVDYEFHQNERGEYVTVIFEEYANLFFFGGKVLTDLLKDMETEFSEFEVHKQMVEDGIKVKFTTKKSKAGFSYTAVEVV